MYLSYGSMITVLHPVAVGVRYDLLQGVALDSARKHEK
jgi:hypothetical protein